MIAAFCALAVTVAQPIGSPVPPPGPVIAHEPGPESGLQVVVMGRTGLVELGWIGAGGVGLGWFWPQLAVALLGRYSVVHQSGIVLGPGERWSEMRVFDGSLWVTSRPRRGGLFQLALEVAVGRGRFVLSDFGSVYAKRGPAWSVAGGVGLGPFYLLVGRSEPSVSLQTGGGFSFMVGGFTHLSLNFTFDVWPLLRPSPPSR